MEETKKSSGVAVYVLLIISVIILCIAVAIFWVTVIERPAQRYVEESNAKALKTVGFAEGRKSKLADRYSDADGDLVADAPKNDKELIDPPTLVFSYIAVEDPKPFKDAWKDFEDYLSKQTGKKVEYLDAKNSDDELKAMKDGKLQVAAFATGLVPAAVNQCGFVPVSTLGSAEGKGEYQVEIIVKPDSAIHQVPDLQGKELTVTEIGSNSGYKAPLVFLKRDFNMLPFKDYTLRYSGGQEQSIAGVAKGEFEAAAVANDVLERDLRANDIKSDQYRSIYKSKGFPKAALGYAYNLKPDLAAKVKKCLLDFNWKGTSVEKHFGTSGQTQFVPVNYKSDWESVRAIDDAVGAVVEIK